MVRETRQPDSPDDRYLALEHAFPGLELADYETTVELWGVESGTLAASLPVNNSVVCLP